MSRDQICTLKTAVHPFQLFVAKRRNDLNTDEYNDIRDALFSHTYSYDAHKPEVQEKLNKLVDLFNELPQVPTFQCKKLETFTFDEIEVHRDDTQEIKKFIRKANYDFIGFHCNHKVYDEQYEMSRVKFMKLIDSVAFKTYTGFISRVINKIIELMKYDNTPDVDEELDPYWDEDDEARYWYCKTHGFPDKHPIKELVQEFGVVKKKTINLCSELMTINNKSCPKCAKCESKRKLYDYVLREVERMRAELVEETEEVEECEITEFMNKYFGNIDRVELSTVVNQWKRYHGFIKQDEIIKMLVESSLYRITNSHNKKYVNRL